MSALRRFTRDNTCPICGGHDRLPRGIGVRCSGFLDSAGDYAHCSRAERASLLAPDFRTEPPTFLHRLHGSCGCGGEHGPLTLDLAPRPSRVVVRGKTTEYVYSLDDQPYMMVRIKRMPDGEKFPSQYSLDAHGTWRPGLNGTPRILYRLDALRRSDTEEIVWWTEGEKDADRLAMLGLTATTYPGGAGKYDTRAVSECRGRRVVVLVDNDDAGRVGSRRVADALLPATEWVKLLELPDLAEHGDVSDWLDAGHTVEDLLGRARAAPSYSDGTAATEAIRTPMIIPPFPLRALPVPLRDLAMAAEDSGSFPADYVAVFGLTALAVAAGGRWQAEVRSGWTERAIIWTGIVGGIATGKSPALERAFGPLREIDNEWHRQWNDRIQEWLDEKSATAHGKFASPRPVQRRIVVDDTTIERLVSLMGENPQGVVIAHDELRGMITGFNQYKGGRGNDRQRFLDLWNGHAISMDRASDGRNGERRTIRAARPTLCVTGGIQPNLLEALSGEDGMVSRFLLARPPRRWLRPTGEGFPVAVLADWARLLRAMIAARPSKPTTVILSPEASEALLDAQRHYADVSEQSWSHHQDMAGKMGKHLARIALTLWAAEPGTDGPIMEHHILSARAICDYFLAHAKVMQITEKNLAASLQDQQLDIAVDRLLEFLRARSGGQAVISILIEARVAGIRTSDDAAKLIDRYEQTYPGCVQRERLPGGKDRVVVVLPEREIVSHD